MKTKTRTLYIENNLKGKPCVTPAALLRDIWNGAADLNTAPLGTTGRPGKGRKKLQVTVTIEEVTS